jgi:quercetin dioxygenase-like cupin family protein
MEVMMDTLEIRPVERLRVAPLGRFAGASRLLDLPAELARLRTESSAVRNGHRQVTLFHRTPVAHVLFAFDAGGSLRRHSANGLVTIHVLDGRLVVDADGHAYDLRAGHALVLNPNVVHAVHAVEPSGMLLTVNMEDC